MFGETLPTLVLPKRMLLCTIGVLSNDNVIKNAGAALVTPTLGPYFIQVCDDMLHNPLGIAQIFCHRWMFELELQLFLEHVTVS